MKRKKFRECFLALALDSFRELMVALREELGRQVRPWSPTLPVGKLKFQCSSKSALTNLPVLLKCNRKFITFTFLTFLFLYSGCVSETIPLVLLKNCDNFLLNQHEEESSFPVD